MEILSEQKDKTTTIRCLKETHFNNKDSDKLKVERCGKMYHANTNLKMVIILVSEWKNMVWVTVLSLNEHEKLLNLFQTQL